MMDHYPIFENHFLDEVECEFDSYYFANSNKNKTLLITGAGTIGNALLDEIVNTNTKVVVLDNSEISLFKLKVKFGNSRNLTLVLCSLIDKKRVKYIIKKYKPNIIIHTAAYKHVSLLEDNVYESIRTNIEGTNNLFIAAKNNNIEQFIYVSTDKAVQPINNMGKTKKIAEMYLESFIDKPFPAIKIIRFGNVINSSGSLIPTVEKQIKNNIDVVVRGKDTKRYFIFSSIVSKSILKLLDFKESGFYLINMRKPIKILNLVEEIILRYNRSIDQITISNLGVGEKEVEELLNVNEKIINTRHRELSEIKGVNYNTNIEVINKLIKLNKKQEVKKVKKLLDTIIFESIG